MHRALSILATASLLLASKPDPGRVTARRLNRYEYNNTIGDLLAIQFHPADDFPADDSGYGFDNNGDVLSLSPVLMEKYLHAAEKIARTAINIGPLPQPTLAAHSRRDNRVEGPGLTVNHAFPAEGDYDILIGVSGPADPVKLSLSLDNQAPQTLPVEEALENRRAAEVRIHVPHGDHLLAAAIIPDGPPVTDTSASKPQPDPYVGYLQVRGPYNPVSPPPSESYRRVFRCGHAPGDHTLECSRANLAEFARRAYRRPPESQEVDNLLRFVEMAQKQGNSLERGMQIALEAILVSPQFLFRIERDPESAHPAPHEIGSFELATRLSYFLWSSTPDDELLQLAAENRLHKPAVLHQQILRMLHDPKADALADNFGGQWLETRNLASIQPDPEKFPVFDTKLRQAMQQETRLFFRSIIHEDRSILDFLDANYTFLNQRLASFYGIPGVEGNQFRRVELPPDSHRGGMLGQASVLTVSSYAARTSPVLRGKWILENILNAPPPPPPPNVPSLDEKAIGASTTARQQMEQHRSNPACRSCHARMDPLGFGLENYDAIGRWRTQDANFPVDASGTLPDGKTFNGPDELKLILVQHKDAFTECLAAKLLTYALGRGLESYDQPAVQSIARRTGSGDYKFSRLIEEIVASAPFQKRRGEEAKQ